MAQFLRNRSAATRPSMPSTFSPSSADHAVGLSSRRALSWLLGLLLSLGLLGPWGWAQATSGVGGELAYFLAEETQAEQLGSVDVASEVGGFSCRKPMPSGQPEAEAAHLDPADKDAPSCVTGAWPRLPQGTPAPRVPLVLPVGAREPLLRPPARSA